MDMRRVETGDEETLPPWYDIPRLKHFQARRRLLLSVGPKGVQLMVRRCEGDSEFDAYATADSRDLIQSFRPTAHRYHKFLPCLHSPMHCKLRVSGLITSTTLLDRNSAVRV